MNDNAFLKREEVINNGVKLPENNSSNNGVDNNMNKKVSNNEYKPMNNMTEKVSNNEYKPMNNMSENVKELSNNKNMYKSENKELTQAKKIPLINKINEHKINQEKANQNFSEYKKFL
jgi:hypothetical protein